jgi:hypothetical protein
MDYILEEVDTSGRKVTRNILVQNNRISYISDRPLRMSTKKVNLHHFNLLPGFVMTDFDLYEKAMEGQLKESLKQLVKLGCTTVVTAFPMYFERDFETNLVNYRELLKESYIDYCLGLSIPIQKLSPKIIRMCQREKLSFISLEIEQPEDFNNIIWEWIRDANFPYQVQLIPNWRKLKFEGKKKKQIIQHFYNTTSQRDIEVIQDHPGDKIPLKLNVLKQLGIYPQKGDFVTGGVVDYLLFNSTTNSKGRSKILLEEYKKIEPSIVVKEGEIIKAGDQLLFEDGQGKELVIKRTGIFKSPQQF